MNRESKKNLIAVALFLLVFGSLLTLATFYDLEVSRILINGVLEPGRYLSDNPFGVFLESVYKLTPVMLYAFCALVFYGLCYKSNLKKAPKIILCTLFFGVAVYILQQGFASVFGYICEHLGESLGAMQSGREFRDMLFIVIIGYFFAVLFVGLAVVAIKDVPFSVWKKLIVFVLAVAIIGLVTGGIVSALKGLMNRARFRSMNYLGDFGLYTRWYVTTNNNEIFDSMALFGASDGFKSFPSGHTSGVGSTYCLIMLIDCLGLQKKWQKSLLWIFPIIWTGLTAVSRIMVGAHYFSDVLIGGTTAFTVMIIVREILICRFSHIKKLFKREPKQKETEA